MILIYTLAWIPMVFIAIANGVARDKGYKRHFRELHAHQISTLTAAILFTLYTWALSLHWPVATASEALIIGAIWVILTVAFEVIFGRLIIGFTWRRIAMDYQLHKGRIWVLLLLWLFALPWVVRQLRA